MRKQLCSGLFLPVGFVRVHSQLFESAGLHPSVQDLRFLFYQKEPRTEEEYEREQNADQA